MTGSLRFRAGAEATWQVLLATYPDAECELIYHTPFQLLVATILSARCTDKQVNKVTPALFDAYPDVEAMSVAPLDHLEELIRPTGNYHAKARSVLGSAVQICDEFGGEVPKSLDELITLPGVGRKTANVVLGNAFGVPGLTPDTHFTRVSRRLGWTEAKTPDRIEADVATLFDPQVWTKLSHVLIWHGRRLCRSRSPLCQECPVAMPDPQRGLPGCAFVAEA